tara:strand:- start:498 stop:641 length:144 start_codon:yes stop_codon:yes gene_type:complete
MDRRLAATSKPPIEAVFLCVGESWCRARQGGGASGVLLVFVTYAGLA